MNEPKHVPVCICTFSVVCTRVWKPEGVEAGGCGSRIAVTSSGSGVFLSHSAIHLFAFKVDLKVFECVHACMLMHAYICIWVPQINTEIRRQVMELVPSFNHVDPGDHQAVRFASRCFY